MKVCFFVNTKDPEIVNCVEFYKCDIKILKDLGFEIVFCFDYKHIPNADFYFVWWWTYAIFPVIYAKVKRKKIVITGTFNFNAVVKGVDYDSRSWVQRQLIKISAIFADMNIMVSTNEYNLIQEQFKKVKAYYSPHVLKTNKYLSNTIEERKKYIFTIAWMSRTNVERKCIPQIIESAYKFKNMGIIIPFVIAGKIEKDAGFLKDSIKDYGLEDIVILLGRISDEEKIQRLKECMIYLQPTLFEGFGVAIAEALLCETPVVTSNVGAVDEVTNGYCTYVNGSSPDEIVNAILMIKSDYNKFLEIAKIGSNYISKNFSYERRKNDFIKIFAEFKLS